ncbi:hypothetical protein SARC_00801 [Sphaeroforma arctica JP610]|uniref:Uncharacterized protein n=1 Tax=Sphaeroforma arctica JP610 TaxID=667725 RepID=A0A0L0GDG8_9EUKA|nr:hypothetical protein SARC_00801 [Sphaeroforma arctica JP610]KNC87057.1 hypothetical protein SARC_00801 [Sphaeroforma arctica JP610]|eukprot:XP_014160959.1 hypothetical protein SARC_00801 [Sphaeroforma arctica JP610]
MGGRSISVPGARTLPVAPSDSPLPYHLAQAAATTQQNTPGFDDRNDVSYSDMHAIEQAGRNSMSSVDDYESDEEIYEDADKFQECIYESFS